MIKHPSRFLMSCAFVLGLCVALPSPLLANALQATFQLKNQSGQIEQWKLTETYQDRADGYAVTRTYSSAGGRQYRETTIVRRGVFSELIVADSLPEGEEGRIVAANGGVSFIMTRPEAAQARATPAAEVLSQGMMGPRLAQALRDNPNLKTFAFEAVVPKARKLVPMRATLVATDAGTATFTIASTSLVVRTFFTQGEFSLKVDRMTGRMLAFEGQPEFFDYSSGRARSVWANVRVE